MLHGHAVTALRQRCQLRRPAPWLGALATALLSLDGFPARASAQGIVTPGVSDATRGWDYRLVAQVLEQLRHQSAALGDTQLSTLLLRVRIEVPRKSVVDEAPNAYALPPDFEGTSLIQIEERWMAQVAGFSELGALFALRPYRDPFTRFADQTFRSFCADYQHAHRTAVRQGRSPPTYQFEFEPYLSRSDPRNATDYILLDKLMGVVLVNTITWTVLHEVGHHALRHSVERAENNEAKRARELAADSFAVKQMEKLGYSHYGVAGFMYARVMTETCRGELDLVETASGTHPSWALRDRQLRLLSPVMTAPWQGERLIYLPIPSNPPLLSSIVLPDARSSYRDVMIAQGDRRVAALVEWNGDAATIYAPREGGGRMELMVEDATRIPLFVREVQYDGSGRRSNDVSLPAIQMDVAALDFIEFDGQAIGDLRRRADERGTFTPHLQRAGATADQIRAVLVAAGQYRARRYEITYPFLKGRTSRADHWAQMQDAAKQHDTQLIAILGQSRYDAFVKSYREEAARFAGALRGGNAWEQQLLDRNLSK